MAAAIPAVLLAHAGASAAPAPLPTSAYSVFARSAKPADAVPVGIDAARSDGQTRAIGGRVGFSTWAYADSEQICVAGYEPGTRPPGQLTPSSACASPDSVAAAGGAEFGTSVYKHDGTTAYGLDGLVPDGASVTLTLADGSSQDLPVVSNGVQYASSDARTAPVTVSWTVDGVTHTSNVGEQG